MSDHDDTDKNFDHLHVPCYGLTSKFKPEQLVVTCCFCGRFYGRCCLHTKETCHHTRIVYTDGACSNNGKSNAVAGIGIAFGTGTGDPDDEDTHQFSDPVDDTLDPLAKRTNQRAELLAALEGLKKVCDSDEGWMEDDYEIRKVYLGAQSPPEVIVTTDSEYVVKGMTKWLPNWKVGARSTS